MSQVELMDIFIEILGGIFNNLTRISERKRRMKEIKRSSKPLGGLKVESVFHPYEVNEMSTGNSWGLSGKT